MYLSSLPKTLREVVRLAKFFRLVKNEYIKTIKKLSTKIMLLLVVLAGVGVAALGAFGKSQMSNESYYYYDNYIADYQSEIDWLEKSKPDGYENEIILYQYYIDNDIGYDDFRKVYADQLTNMFTADELKMYLDILFKDGDWKELCTVLRDNALSESQRWAFQYRLDNDIPFGDTWKDDMIMQAMTAKSSIDSQDENNSEKDAVKEAEDNYKIAMYRLDNNIEINTADNLSLFETYEADQINFWTIFYQSASMVSIIGLLIIVVAGSSVASEFSQGTIKFLLINPVKRWKILMSKYFTVLTLGYIMLLLLYLVMIPASGLFVGFEGIGAPYLYVEDGAVHSMSSFAHAANNYLLNSVEIVVMATLAFAVSSLFRSSAFSIGISVFLMFAGNTIVSLLKAFNQDWARYLVFSNTNLASIAEGDPIFAQQSLTFALVVLAAHMMVFLLTAWDGFVKREV